MEAVVLAAHGLSVAGGTRASTDDGDGSATNTDDGVDILDNDSEETELLSNGGRAGSAGRVAALNWASIALGSGGSGGTVYREEKPC